MEALRSAISDIIANKIDVPNFMDFDGIFRNVVQDFVRGSHLVKIMYSILDYQNLTRNFGGF